jgi:hypothetical protein
MASAVNGTIKSAVVGFNSCKIESCTLVEKVSESGYSIFGFNLNAIGLLIIAIVMSSIAIWLYYHKTE